jgi:uncharacterized protein YjbI with pentapeptide repeats
MKNLNGIFLVVFLVVLLIAFNGCGDSSSEKHSNVITENDLFANPQIIATPEQTLVIQLEAPDGEGQVNDIGEKGVDEVPVYYSEDVNQTFCWEGDASDAGDRMELIDSSGNKVLTEYIDSECTVTTVNAGHYTMRFIHGDQSEDTQTIFIRSVEDINISRGIVNAASVQDNIETLLTTNSCIGCDLHDANLTGVILISANLRSANLAGAILSDAILAYANLYHAYLRSAYLAGANLRGANLSDAYLSYSILRNVNLSYADLSYADLIDANLYHANLTEANLTKANLTKANLTEAILYRANLTKANLTGAILTNTSLHYAELSGATWIDGTICRDGSVSQCL